MCLCSRVCETNRSEELSTSIDSHYDLDDLDDDWLMLLQQIDERYAGASPFPALHSCHALLCPLLGTVL